jgi:hypothetical protein
MSPPAGSRARLRGDAIRRLAGKNDVFCTWEGIFDKTAGKALDLRNPWQAKERWKPLEEFASANDASSQTDLEFLLSEEII